MLFDYLCPDCRSSNDLHDPDCKFGHYSATDIDLGYEYILANLISGPQQASSLIPSEGAETVDILPGDDVGAATDTEFVRSALYHLSQSKRIAPVDGNKIEDLTSTKFRIRPPEEYREEVSEPQMEPIKTIYEKGSVPGCHDNAVFAMIAFYEMVGLSWEETKEQVLNWIEETGTWERGGFAESSPEQLVEQKQHVYESGYGWKEKAQAAKRVIDQKL